MKELPKDMSWQDEPDKERLNHAYGLLIANSPEAVEELQALAEKGSVMSMVYLGWAHRKGVGAKADLSQAESWFRRASDKGSSLALYYLGKLYLEQKKYPQAEHTFLAGAAKNDASALSCLGRMYLRGEGTNKQVEEAHDLLERSVALGNVWAKRALAGSLMAGNKGPLGRVKGFFLFLSAMKDGLVLAITDPSSERLRS